jgi:dTDP-glucose pyrophosphorylase/predicted transcriptional regulator
MSRDWRKILIKPDASVRDAVEAINRGGKQICLVVSEDNKLLGTVSDGDIRRGLLKGIDMEAPVTGIMNSSPQAAPENSSNEFILNSMQTHVLRQIPKLDGDGRVVGLAHINDLVSPPERRENWVVLMAGGLGTRLRPLTEDTPKPLLSVGDKPILETIFESFVDQNFHKFYISVNYKAHAIKEHFGDGMKWNVEIRYLEEEAQLGTSGALQLIPEKPDLPLVIMNGDLLTHVNFQDLLDYHQGHDAKATMCVREYGLQVPFGVVDIKDNKIQDIDEKPLQRFFVNAGIYVIEPELIGLIPEGEPFHMTDLFGRAAEQGHHTAAFPIYEYWLDVGRIDDLERANHDFENGLDK